MASMRYLNPSILTRKSLGLILSLILLLLIPVLIIIAIALYCARKLIGFLGPRFRPDFDKMLTTNSSTFASDEITTNPKCTIVVCGTLKGNLSLDLIRDKIKSIIGCKQVGSQLKNIELSQYPSQWMGYYFWEWDRNFDIANHVNYHTFTKQSQDTNNTVVKVNYEELREFESALNGMPFAPKRSPWEVFVVENVESDNNEEICSKIYLRLHHSICDGYSLLKLLLFDLCDDGRRSKELPKPNPLQRPLLQKLLFYFKLFTISLYSFVQCVVDTYDINDWRLSTIQNPNNKFIYSVSNKISLMALKEFKYAHGVGMSAVVYAGITAAIRKGMLKKNGKVPETIHSMLSLPMKDHPAKLRNHFIGVPMPLPVGCSDSVKRLKMIQKTLDSMRNSTVLLISFYVLSLIGGLPSFLVKRVINDGTLMTAVGSSFPGPKYPEWLLGHEFTDFYWFVGPTHRRIGVAFTTITYTGSLRFAFGISKSVLSTQAELDEIPKAFEEEFALLRQNIQV